MPSQQQPYTSIPFWDFIQSLDPNHAPGGGVDHNNNSFPQFFGGFPFGPQGHPAAQRSRGPWGGDADWDQSFHPWAGHGHGRRGRHGDHFGDRHEDHHHGRRGRRHGGGMSDDETREPANADAAAPEYNVDNEKAESPETLRDAPDPAEVAPEDAEHSAPEHGPGGRHGPGFHGRGRCGGRGGFRRGGRGGPRHFHGPPPPYPQGPAPFDFAGIMRGLGSHPFFQNLREQAEGFRGGAGQDSSNNDHANNADPDAFVPPVDVFNTERDFVLHVALPGAKKEHIGVNWDPDSSVLNIAGVVHRLGDEDFLRTLSAGERKVGVFERNVTLPPAGAEKDEIDGDAITAKMEDGVLIITVPKVEKEWTEIRKVDIE